MKYEFRMKYISRKTGKCKGHSADHFDSLEVAARERAIRGCMLKSERAVLERRKVGEWEEVQDE